MPEMDIDLPLDEDLEIALDAEADELEVAIEDEPTASAAAAPTSTGLISPALVEVLPADFPLPILARFIPNTALRTAVEEATRDVLAIDVTAPDGLQKADVAITVLRGNIDAVLEHFKEPASVAFELHRHITGLRAAFVRIGEDALKEMARRVFHETDRRQAAERERLRQEQEAANARAREQAAREAEDAAANQAPPEVVEQLREEAKTTTAAPVGRVSPPPLQGNTTTKTWKGRIEGTPPTDEPNPKIADLSVAQRHQVLQAMKAVVEGRAPISLFEINWSYVNKRAAADKSAMGIPGFEAFQVGGLRAKRS